MTCTRCGNQNNLTRGLCQACRNRGHTTPTWGRTLSSDIENAKHWIKQRCWRIFLAGYATGLTMYVIFREAVA